MDNWSCKKCKTEDLRLRYPSGKMNKCMDCQRWYNVSVNSKRPRKNKASPKLNMCEADFLKWCRNQDRSCAYCGIKESDVRYINLKTQTGHKLAALGIDRLDSTKGYSEDNIVFCCFACNKAKGDVFTHEEMITIGSAISSAWKTRLESCGNENR